MIVNISDEAQPVNEADLLNVERRLGRKIPAQYRKFLLQHNGGDPDPSEFSMTNQLGEVEDAVVRYFLGVDVSDEELGIEYVIDMFSDRMPRGFFPIARDAGGNVICIEESTGKIFFWDHERESDTGEPPSRKNLYLVKDSFEEFLKELH